MIVALTGRSGCGKTAVAEMLRQKGYSVLDADKVAAEVLVHEPACVQELAAQFGKSVLDENGAINKRELSKIAFSSAQNTLLLTQITHPYIIKRLLAAATKLEQQGEKLVFVDGAVIIGHEFEKYCKKIVVVACKNSQQVARIMERDGITAAAAKARLKKQLSMAAMKRKAHLVINNDATPYMLQDRVNRALKIFESWAHEA